MWVNFNKRNFFVLLQGYQTSKKRQKEPFQDHKDNFSLIK